MKDFHEYVLDTSVSFFLTSNIQHPAFNLNCFGRWENFLWKTKIYFVNRINEEKKTATDPATVSGVRYMMYKIRNTNSETILFKLRISFNLTQE